MKTTLAAASETTGEGRLTETEGGRENGREVQEESPLCPSRKLCPKQFPKHKHVCTFTKHVILWAHGIPRTPWTLQEQEEAMRIKEGIHT